MADPSAAATPPGRVLLGLLSIDQHLNWPGHPESPARLESVSAALSGREFDGALQLVEGREATDEELCRVHRADYLDQLRRLSAAGGGALDPDTGSSSGSYRTAVRAAGAGLAVVDSLVRGEGRAGFVAVRPPGHHAGAGRAMGFCLLNNVAIAAAALTARGERVMVVDWDVHHGNGTQDIFWEDPAVLYVSTHQWPAYPGSGRATEVGGGAGFGYTLNVPLPAGSAGDAARTAFERLVLPAGDNFAPDWVLVSAGFDAHRDDPLADLRWSSGDFAGLTRWLLELAPPGRLIAFLEGGYDLRALAESATATVAALAGVERPSEPESVANGGVAAVAEAADQRSRALEGGPLH